MRKTDMEMFLDEQSSKGKIKLALWILVTLAIFGAIGYGAFLFSDEASRIINELIMTVR